MTRADVQAQLQGIASEIFQVPPEKITPDLATGAVEQWDSLGHLQLFMAIEEKLGVKFTTDEIIALSSLPQITDNILSKTK